MNYRMQQLYVRPNIIKVNDVMQLQIKILELTIHDFLTQILFIFVMLFFPIIKIEALVR